MAAADLLGALVLSGILGVVGQGARTVVGLKKLYEENQSKEPSERDTFIASRLFISLFIGFISGVIAALSLGLTELANATTTSIDLLLGIAAAGYAGTDIIEAFVPKIGSGAKLNTTNAEPPPVPPNPAPSNVTIHVTGPSAPQVSQSDARREAPSADTLTRGFTLNLADSAAEAHAVGGRGDSLDLITPALVKKIFIPATPMKNIIEHLPVVLDGLREKGLVDRQMLLMALATIRAETEGFVPISEFISKFNTAKKPFDLYEPGTSAGNRVGNTKPGDGARFKGRGFVQLTGRENYTKIGPQVGADLVEEPELANDPKLAGLILAQFLLNHRTTIDTALAAKDLKAARRAVNGGSHGLPQFEDSFNRGNELVPDF